MLSDIQSFFFDIKYCVYPSGEENNSDTSEVMHPEISETPFSGVEEEISSNDALNINDNQSILQVAQDLAAGNKYITNSNARNDLIVLLAKQLVKNKLVDNRNINEEEFFATLPEKNTCKISDILKRNITRGFEYLGYIIVAMISKIVKLITKLFPSLKKHFNKPLEKPLEKQDEIQPLSQNTKDNLPHLQQEIYLTF